MKTTYRFFYLLSIFAILSIFVACSGDEGDGPGTEANQFKFQGDTYAINDPVVQDYGYYGAGNYDLYYIRITDGEFTAPSGVHYVNEAATYELEIEFLVEDTNDFLVPGTYEIDDSSEAFNAGESLSFGGSFSEYLDGESIYSSEYYFTSGSVTVSGTYPDFTVAYTGVMTKSIDGSTINVSGSFSASFRTILGD